MDYARLKELLQEHPGATLGDLNALVVSRVESRFVNERTLYAELGPEVAETILQKLEAVAGSNSPMAPMLKRVSGWMAPGQLGVDIGHPSTRGMIAQLGAAGVLTAGEVDSLLDLGVAQYTISDYLGRPVEDEDLRLAGQI